MMNVLIIEDEDLAAERLERMLNEIDPEVNVRAKIRSVKEAINWLKEHTVDLIFIDIQLSDGLSFSIFDEIHISTPLVFTTAYDQYAIRAFQHNSISYLLKPIRKKELKESLEKFERFRSAFSIDFETIRSIYQGEKPAYKKRFLISIGEKLKKIEVTDIAYFYAMDKSVFCRTFENKALPIDQSLDALEELLDPEIFFRINRKYIVNMNAIEQMIAWSRSRIKLELNPPVKDEEGAIVSISRSSDFKKWMNS
ncbi:MAG TPA: LytTR family DNA-binding domain-containing protein [Gracilimonas sp.]|nr:LytTR family DNA-binding domain-containing protein [Gracilimonas sp.]